MPAIAIAIKIKKGERKMRALQMSLALTFIFLLFNQAAQASQEESQVTMTDINIGEKLVRQLWEDMKTGDTESIIKKTAQGFQSIHQDGARNREEELDLIKRLKLGEYELNNFKVTEAGPVLIVTYFVSVKETIGGKELSKEPEPRMSLFLDTADGWQWIAHANVRPLK
jgi:hypothetical protein